MLYLVPTHFVRVGNRAFVSFNNPFLQHNELNSNRSTLSAEICEK